MSRREEQLSLFAALHATGAEYAVVGGVAVNAHGFIRNTRDLDIFLRPTRENAEAVFRALQRIGAPLDGLDATDLLTDDASYQFQSAHGRIDFLTFIGEMPFDRVWQNRVETEIEGVVVRFISKADLIENKRQLGRLIDLVDVEQLSLLPDTDGLRLPEE